YLLFLKNCDDPNCFHPEQPIERIRGKHVDRKLYSNEFDIIWEKQRPYYKDILTDENKKRIKDDCIFYQRPLKSQKHLVGKCWFEPSKRCTPVSSIEYQEFRIWQNINNIRVTYTGRFRDKLSIEKKIQLFNVLNQEEYLSHAQIKKLLQFPSLTSFNDLPEKIKGNTTHARLSKALGEKYYWSLEDNKKKSLWHTLFFATDEEWLMEYGTEKLGLSPEHAKKYAAVHLEDGYGNLSLKALLKGNDKELFENGILYHLKKGSDYAEAAAAAGYHHSHKNEYSTNRILEDKIIIAQQDYIRNPLVQQCISESARLVNAIIK